jgi:nucleotide-binding universal stress UspA family protein
MRVVIAVRPGPAPEWIEEASRGFPLAEPVEVVLVSALDLPRPPLTSPGRAASGLYGAALQTMRADTERAGSDAAEALRRRLTPRFARVDVRIVDARAAAAVIQTAAGWKADLILIGPGPGPGPLRLLLGSVTSDVVRRAPCPVLVAGPDLGPIRRVLAATDGSLHAEAALRFLAGLPIAADSWIRLCAVAEPVPGEWRTRLGGLGRRPVGLAPLDELQHRTARRSLARAREVLAGVACPTQESLRTGNPRRVLANEIAEWAPDLLVLGARGRTAGPDAPFGSLTAALLGRPACPTLVVRA